MGCFAPPLEGGTTHRSATSRGRSLLRSISADVCSSGDVIAFEGPNATSGLFATYPQPYLTTFGGIVDQFTGTAVLMASIFAMIDEKNGLAPSAGKRKSKEI